MYPHVTTTLCQIFLAGSSLAIQLHCSDQVGQRAVLSIPTKNARTTPRAPYCIPRHPYTMAWKEPDYEELTKTLTENFNILAEEVQRLGDRKTILEHKLRFAHEQVSIAISLFLNSQSLAIPLHMMKILALDLELLLQPRPTNYHVS